MYKVLFSLAALCGPAMAMAAGSQVDVLNQKCEQEKTSIFRANNGTPSCDKLAKIYSDYEARTQVVTQGLRQKCEQQKASMFRANNGTPACDQLNQVVRDRAAVQPLGPNYRYDTTRKQYCYFSDAGAVIDCP
ncbi:hypothetical protein [Pseudomonas sp. NPDC007930]|uniref:hypothetical protein n=1 Tax=Pseudomonas sp. NPDC007930 TaxID=3364417 RepID=UPI0036E82290